MTVRHLSKSRFLVVIDMQPAGFPLALAVTNQVLREIKTAMENGWTIMIVEYDLECAGPTDSRITALLADSGYQYWFPVKKKAEDGSAEIIAAAGLPLSSATDEPPVFRVVGVTTDDCIAKSVFGLVKRLSNCVVELVTDACYNWQGHRFDWSLFATHSNIELLFPPETQTEIDHV